MAASKPGSKGIFGTFADVLAAGALAAEALAAGTLAAGTLAVGTLACTLTACNVAEPPDNTGGTDVPSSSCGRGIVVVSTDYQSTNVSLVSVQGQVLSSSFLSSASGATGLSSPLGGDVLLPTQRQDGDELLLLDRFPASVLTWVDVRSGEPSGQLSVSTGFASNPRDLVQLSANKAYVSRYDPNYDAGHEPFDMGSDVLIIDPSARTIVGRIDMTPAMAGEDGAFFPRPDKMLVVGDEVYVLLGGYSGDFVASAASRVVTLQTASDTISQVFELEEMHGCTGMVLSPAGNEVAVACSGEFGGSPTPTLAQSGIVLLSLGSEVKERRRYPAAKFGDGSIAGTLAYVSDTRLVFTTLGQFEEGATLPRNDELIEVDLDSGAFDVVLQSEGEPFSLGDVRCIADCGVCFLADASRDGGRLHRFSVREDGSLEAPDSIVVDSEIGLPPRNLGGF